MKPTTSQPCHRLAFIAGTMSSKVIGRVQNRWVDLVHPWQCKPNNQQRHNHDTWHSSFYCKTTCFAARHLNNECAYSTFNQTRSFLGVLDGFHIYSHHNKKHLCWSVPISDRVGSQQCRLFEQCNHRRWYVDLFCTIWRLSNRTANGFC